MAAATVLEVGPADVRLPGGRSAALAAVALQAIDDPVALVDTGDPVPVGVAQLWRTVIAEICPAEAALHVVHPSWWSRRRIDTVRAAAGRPVTLTSRAQWFGRHRRGPLVVLEIAPGAVAVSGCGPVRLACHADLREIAAVAAGRARTGATVLIDAPDAVPGSGRIADSLADLLRHSGIEDSRVHRVNLDAISPPRSGRVAHRLAMIATVAAIASIGTVLLSRTGGTAPTPPSAGPVTLAEGRVAVRIPRGWQVRRVTDGPGARRMEIGAPGTDPVLHITAAYAPQTTLEHASEVLRRAAASEPAGVFVDFRIATSAGRPALIYRERRRAREILWTVVLDGSMRIAIGCQISPGRRQAVQPVCDDAVGSVREFIGTETPP